MENPPDGNKYVRKTYIVDKRFQLKYTLIIALGAAVISTGFGAAVYYKTTEATHVASTAMLRWSEPDLRGAPGLDMDADAIETIKGAMDEQDRNVLLAIVLFIAALVVVLTLWGILLTHRIAGPLFAISRYLDQIRAGKLANVRPLRKKDELKGFFTVFNEMVTELRSRTEAEITTLEGIAMRLNDLKSEGADVNAVQAQIRGMLDAKRTYLNKGSE